MENRTKLIGVRVSKEEMEVLSRAAKGAERKVSDWMRWIGLRECGGVESTVSEVEKEPTRAEWALKMSRFGTQFVRSVKEAAGRDVWAGLSDREVYEMVKAEWEHSRGDGSNV
jgi:hypothetical protein